MQKDHNNNDDADTQLCTRRTTAVSSPILVGQMYDLQLIAVSRQSDHRYTNHKPGNKLPLLSARPLLPSQPATRHHLREASTKLYHSVTEVHRWLKDRGSNCQPGTAAQYLGQIIHTCLCLPQLEAKAGMVHSTADERGVCR